MRAERADTKVVGGQRAESLLTESIRGAEGSKIRELRQERRAELGISAQKAKQRVRGE
jgi:hypothetical protein